MTASLTSRDLDIIESLTRRVRLLSLDQITAVWWAEQGSARVVRRRLGRLVDRRLLATATINAHPLLHPEVPLFAWEPGEEEPDFEAVARRARVRWTLAAVPTEVYWATPVAASMYASGAHGLASVIHRDHDLLLSDVYVHYRTLRPDEACAWLGEDALPKAGYRVKDPDAFLFDDAGRVRRVIESTGRYGTAQVRAFHDYCAELETPYELW
jgi:hypothetical protein